MNFSLFNTWAVAAMLLLIPVGSVDAFRPRRPEGAIVVNPGSALVNGTTPCPGWARPVANNGIAPS
ncbi:hypothetical protein HDV05_007865, partial [Chytridiales sp. JEL 0842]